ncbi:MAG: glycine cleavage system protein H [Candidatus Marinimicrobia bacterium]|nr:glycine cleavage system protein H [Candidatus Neomarinimicrobiota bacterium]|tara:strand:- start:3837 stop:4214 length:378 start_codon:yes stop_codon:yes gene_type:complete
MKIPPNLLYTESHEWILIENDISTIGITDFAQNELGDIVFLELPEEGDDIVKNEIFGTIEAVKTVADLYSPMSGKVINVNQDLNNEPELVNHDPFGMGWLIKIQSITAGQSKNLLTADKYTDLIG